MREATQSQSLDLVVNAVLLDHPEKIQQYQTATPRTKMQIRGFFLGMTCKRIGGRGNVKRIKETIAQRLG